MDEIFEQMLSTPPWAEGVAGMTMDSIGTLSKLGAMMPTAAHLIGAMENQAQEHQDALFEVAHQDHLQTNNSRGILSRLPSVDGSLEGHSYQQSSLSPNLVGGSWKEPFLGSAPPLPMSQGMPGPFPASGDGLSNDLNPSKRLRVDDDTLKVNVMQSQANGDHIHLGHHGGGTGENGTTRPRVRARRGQATDPHSIAERNRRERIAERMKALQELVPDSNKTDKASMLDEIINYVKFLQMQVKCLSMCRLGGAGAAAPLLADLPTEGAANFMAANVAQANGTAAASQEGIAFAERQVARLMDEDMSAAMQYLQSKGLCLMPISLATAISSTGQRQPAAPSKSSDASEGEKQVMELQALAASRSANSMASLVTNADMDTSGGFAKSNVPTSISKETSSNEAVTVQVGLGLPSSDPKVKEEDER